MKHKNCNGRVVYKYEQVQLKCMKCEKVWDIISDFSDINNRPCARSRKGIVHHLSIFSNFKTYRTPSRVPNWMYNFVSNDKLRLATEMIDFPSKRNWVGLDLGCNDASFAEYLVNNFGGTIIGVDISRFDLRRAKMRTRLQLHCEKSALSTVELICCDMDYLPLRTNSVDLVICMSVLEHAPNLSKVISEIKEVTKKGGTLIAGYPMETGLFNAVLKLFLPRGSRIRDPKIMGENCFSTCPETHKQSFKTIRRILQKHFLGIQREKCFFTKLPDLVSWYECFKLKKN